MAATSSPGRFDADVGSGMPRGEGEGADVDVAAAIGAEDTVGNGGGSDIR